MKIMEKVLLSLAAVLLVSCGSDGAPANNNGDGPSVTEVRPIADETEVSVDATISVTFDRTIACVSFEDAFSLRDPAKDEVLGQINCVNDVVTMKPLNQLKPATTYTITIDTALVDSDDVAIARTYSWSFTTTNKAWGSPVQIDNHPAQVVTHQDFVPPLLATTPFDVYDVYGGLRPHLAYIDVNDNGMVGVAWSLRPSGGQFYPSSGAGPTYGFRQFQPGTGWETEQSISYPYNAFYAFGNPMRPVAGVTSADTLLAAWGHGESQPVKGTNLGNLSIGGDLAPSNFSNPYGEFSMDSDQLGNSILAYPFVLGSVDVSNISVYRYVSGTGWDIGQVLDAQLDRVFSNARVAVNSSGFATVIWIDTTTFSVTTPQESRLCYSHYSPDLDEWTGVDCFAAVPGSFIKHADVGIDDQGNSVAVWSILNEIFYSVHALDSVLDWKDLPIETVSDDEGGLVENLQFAMNKSGQVILGWNAAVNNEKEGRASSYIPDLDEWTEPVTFFSGQLPSSLHDVDINDQGNALVVYTEGDFGTTVGPPYYLPQTTRSVDLIAVPHNPLDGWLTPQIIRSDGSYYNPRIAIDNAGNATAVFSHWQGKDAFFWASRYE